MSTGSDVPSSAVDVNQPGREVPADLPRVDFFHWVLIDLPPLPTVIQEGEFSRGFLARRCSCGYHQHYRRGQ